MTILCMAIRALQFQHKEGVHQVDYGSLLHLPSRLYTGGCGRQCVGTLAPRVTAGLLSAIQMKLT